MIRMLGFLATLSALMVVPVAKADGLAIKPGLWKTTTNTITPMGQPMTRTTQECVKRTRFDPAEMMQNAERCRITRNDVSGNQADFSMECTIEGGQTSVTGSFVSDGDRGSGNMTMSMDGGGMKMEMKMDWTAERVGDC